MKAFNIFSIHHKISVSIAIMITLMSVMPVGDPTAAAQNPLVDPHGIALDVANGKMYWTDDSADRIQRANLDGSSVETLLRRTKIDFWGNRTGYGDPYGIALDVAGGKMYWADEGANEILRANLDGSNIEILVSRGLDDPHGIALDVANGKMYWTDDSADRIQRANLDGSNIETLLRRTKIDFWGNRTGYGDPYGIALDVAGGKMYWADEGANEILRANLDGSNIEILVSRGLDDPHGIALDITGGKMYWTDDSADRVQRANLDGSNVETLLRRTKIDFWGNRTGYGDPYGIALDVAGGKMYWADEGANEILRANLDGSNIEILITSGELGPSIVSDDIFSLSTDGTPVRSGNTFTLRLSANDVTDLARWQTDIAFDSDLLEAVEVSEGNFLKAEDVSTFFLPGTIDNTVGEITKLGSVRLINSVSGTGTLLLVTFKAKAVGETRVTLSNFRPGSSSGKVISSEVPEIKITIEDRAFPASDVNQDGQVNVQDLILVAQHLGADASVNRQADVNSDGTINVLDLIVVAQHLGESTAAAAPSSVDAIDILELDPAMVQAWIAQARIENDGSLAFQQGIENLQQLLASLLPDKTALLPNYPNPFNPETWIPYDLAEAADVTVHIYTAEGTLIRTLALGHQAAGIYQTRSRAAYWNGKNEFGEPVASGVYFYTLTADDFSATRKMLIRK